MAGGLIPTAKTFFLCDDVVGNPTTGKPMVVNLMGYGAGAERRVVPVPAAKGLPVRLAARRAR